MSLVIGDWAGARLSLARCGLLAAPWVRRELRLPPYSPAREAGEGMRWSGEFIPVFSRIGRLRRLVGYAKRGDGWTSDPGRVFETGV